jgi:hypothetical protein
MQRIGEQPDEQGIDRRKRIPPDALRQVRPGMEVRGLRVPVSGGGGMNNPDILVRLRESDGGYFMRQMFTEAADEIERLRAERDEARREVCNLSIHPPRDYALERGWDCFKEAVDD